MFYCNENKFTGKINQKPFVAPVLHAVLFYFIYSDLISIVPFVPTIRAGALPSFAACVALETFWCNNNQFTGKIIKKPFVVPVLLAVLFCFLDSDLILLVLFVLPIRTGELPSFAACVALTEFQCRDNKFTGK